MASYAVYVRTRLAGDPELEAAVKSLISNDFEASLFTYCLQDQLTLPGFYELTPKAYATRLDMLLGLLPVGQEMLTRVETYQLVATSLQNLMLDGALRDEHGNIVELGHGSFRVGFLNGQADLRDCFLYNFLILAGADPVDAWIKGRAAAGRPLQESYETVYARGISTTGQIIDRLHSLELTTKNARAGR